MKCKKLRIRTEKGCKFGYCKLKNDRVSVFCHECSFEVQFNGKSLNKKHSPVVGKKHKSTKATEIPKKVKMTVWERDKHCCIFCGTPVPWNMANSHFIKRSHLGLGIEQNIMTNCLTCHEKFEKEPKDGWMHEKARRHFKECYEGWDEDSLIYKKTGDNYS